MDKQEDKFIVRLYDGFDNEWIDITGPVSRQEAQRILNEHTKSGTEHTKFGDIDYYRVFPANTAMIYFSGRNLSQS